MNKASLAKTAKEHKTVIALIIVIVFFAWCTDGDILLPQCFRLLVEQNACLFLIAMGMMLCLLTGGNVDLSVGSAVGFIGAAGAVLMENAGMNIYAVIVVMMIIGLLIGTWQGFWIAYVHVPSLVMTLIDMVIFRGLAYALLQGRAVILTSEKFLSLFNGSYISDRLGIRAINMTCILVVAIALIYNYILFGTRPGSYFHTAGNNEKVIELSGINVKNIYFLSYLNMGVLAALAGMLMIARMRSAQPGYGIGYEIDAIGICLLGGASLYGGAGTIPGVIAGVALLGIMDMGMNLTGLDNGIQKMIKGLVFVTVFIYDIVFRKPKMS